MRRASRTWCRWTAQVLLVQAVASACTGRAQGTAADAPAAAATAALAAWNDRAGGAAAGPAELDSLQAHFAAPVAHGSAEWQDAATILRQHPHPGRATVAPRHEPGERLVLRGVVRDASGRPVAGAVLHVFQADAAGAYTPLHPMDEAHARLSAWIKTGADARYVIETIRPGGYPKAVQLDGQDRKLPAHIHYEVQSAGGAAAFQLVFADDPRLDAHWRAWARDGGHPIAEVRRGAGGAWTGTLDVTLQP